jgi:hypothetical protein
MLPDVPERVVLDRRQALLEEARRMRLLNEARHRQPLSVRVTAMRRRLGLRLVDLGQRLANDHTEPRLGLSRPRAGP